MQIQRKNYLILGQEMVELLLVTKHHFCIQIESMEEQQMIKCRFEWFLAAAKKGLRSDGVELNTWLVQYSRVSALYHGVFKQTAFYRKDLWKFDVSPYRYIVIFGVEQMVCILNAHVFVIFP